MDRLQRLMLHAAEGSYLEIQSLLNEGVNPDEKDCYGRTPLMHAAQGSHAEVFKLLANSGADIHCCDDYEKGTVMHYAASGESVEIVQWLANKGVAFDKKDSKGRTPLMEAARWSSREIVELFINLGADVHSCDNKGWSMLHHASFRGKVDICQTFMSKGVAFDTIAKNSEGCTPLMASQFSEGCTPLMVATQFSYMELVEMLIELGADIHLCDSRGWTLLHFASCGVSRGESVELVQYLMNKGVAFSKNSKGTTPLHFAVQSERMKIVNYLLNSQADCNLEDNRGESPFNILINKGRNVDTIKLCIEKGAYVKYSDYYKLLKRPLLKEAILKNVKLCSQAVLNKFNNRDLPLLYKRLATAQNLPHIDKMKIRNRSGMAQQIEQSVSNEIEAKGFCNLFKMVPLVLGILCVKSSIENSIPTFNQANSDNRQNGLKRSCNKHKYPCKKMCN